ncbi:MauE/DoxX family redox-associated membrane protein [Chryseobacterium arthrosphaerae]|uniref:MauE/DoxX family redox-associated membrane protein n=1 Tax=Chryseobacterium arthrosphaerae TaxID=651561 RepID=UPI003D348525
MKNTSHIIPTIISYFFILLLVYASVSKLMDFENFQVQLAQSPLLHDYAIFVSYAVIMTELLLVAFLAIPNVRWIGLFCSLGLMSAFTAYIYLILHFSDSVPCSCGGILEKMDWNDHLVFNILCVLLAIIAILVNRKGITNKKKAAGFISMAIALPLLLLSLIFYPYIITNQGNFTRRIVYPLKGQQRILEFPTNNYYFAGNYGDTLFVGHRKTPLLLSTIPPDFNSIHVDTIKLDNYKHQFVSVTINVSYPYFSVSDGKVPVIFEGKLPSLEAYDTGINRLYFSRLYMLEPKQYLFKTMLVKTKESELGILNSISKEYFINPQVLQTKADGVFDTDGNITIDRQNKKIIYTHLYRNEVITTNFDLGNISRNRTIDSLSQAIIETKTLKNGQTKLLKSPTEINLMQTVSDNKFYNLSQMRGKNESFWDFRNNDVIDVYDSSTKKYLYSFYIENEEGIKIKSILATKHYFYVLSGNHITRYAFK